MSICEREPGDILAEVQMMHAANDEKIYWIVEGVSDVKFFKPRVSGNIHLIDATGKYKILSALERYDGIDSFSEIPVLGIIDNDYDWLTLPSHPSHIISTEPRDLEGILLRANLVSCVLAEHANHEAVVEFETKNNTTVLQAVLDRGLIFGKIRAVNNLHFKKCLKKFKPIQFFSPDWTYDEMAALEKATALGVGDSVEDLKSKILTLPDVDPWHYIRGHDAIDILCGGIVSVLGGGKACNSNLLEPILRQALSFEAFSKTKLFKETVAWHESKGLTHPYQMQGA